jgi:hypothetical protein
MWDGLSWFRIDFTLFLQEEKWRSKRRGTWF